MTIRTIEQDNRYTVQTSSGPVHTGSYYVKYQNGGNGLQTEEHGYSMTSTYQAWPVLHGWDSYGSWYFSLFGSMIPNSPLWTANDELKLLAKLKERVRMHSWNAAVDLAEARKSLKTIRQAASTTMVAMRALRRADFSTIGRLFLTKKGVPLRNGRTTGSSRLDDAYLQITYGLRPILQSAYEATRLLARNLTVRRTTVRAGARGVGGLFSAASPPEYLNSTWDQKSVLGTQLKVILDSDWNNTGESLLRELGFTDPASVVWELTPWSFVYDWFIPIGQFLELRNFFGGVQGATYVRSVFDVRGVRVIPNSGGPWHWSGGVSVSRLVNMTRTISPGIDVPLPSLKSLKSVIGNDFVHCQNAIALLTSSKVRF